jgi:hypothetical protein
MREFALAMSFVSLGILDFERHRLEGLIAWHFTQWCEPESQLDAPWSGLGRTAATNRWPERVRRVLRRFKGARPPGASRKPRPAYARS